MTPSGPINLPAGTPDLPRTAASAGRWLLIVAVPGVLLALVWRELSGLDYAAIGAALRGAHPVNLAGAAAAAVAAVAVMGLYDVVAFPATPTLGGRRRWLLASAIFGWTNLITLGPLGGPVVRLFFYRRHGMSAAQLAGGFAGHYAGMVGGILAWLAAAWAAWWLGPSAAWWWVLPAALSLSVGLTFTLGGVLNAAARRSGHRPGVRRNRYTLLGAVSFFDWGLHGVAFLLAVRAAGHALPLVDAERVILSGYAAGIVSMAPGGLGSADAVWLKLLILDETIDANAASAVVVLFRAVFYLVPWALAGLTFAWLLTLGFERPGRAGTGDTEPALTPAG